MVRPTSELDINSYCSEWLAEHLLNGSQLLLDGDGVLVRGDSLSRTRLLEPSLISSLMTLESIGVPVGLATARGQHFVERLRGEGLLIKGTSILEEGQAVLKNGELKYLVPSEYTRFLGEVRQKLKQSPAYKKSWGEVSSTNEDVFCRGSHQWQGRARASWWFHQTGRFESDARKLQLMFLPTIAGMATEYGFSLGKDISLSLVRMRENNLAMMVIRFNGFEKATAAGYLDKPVVFIADGFGDLNLGNKVLESGGGVMGLRTNLDISNEPNMFLNEVADWVLDNPKQLAQIVRLTAKSLARPKAMV